MIFIYYNIFAQSTFNICIKAHQATLQQVHLKGSLAGSNEKLGKLSIAAIMVASVRKQWTLKKMNFNESLVI